MVIGNKVNEMHANGRRIHHQVLGQHWHQHFGKEVTARNPKTVGCGRRVEDGLFSDKAFDLADHVLQRLLQGQRVFCCFQFLAASKEQFVSKRVTKPFERAGYSWLRQPQPLHGPHCRVFNQKRIKHAEQVQVERR